MLTYSFDNIGSETLYEHLYRLIRRDIRGGTLKAGEALPSKRSFARQLNVSIVTVENAYAQLLMEGYIYALPRKGFFVSDLGDTLWRGEAGGSDRKTCRTDGEEKLQEQAKKVWFADFSGNQMYADSFPFTTWAKVSREVLSSMQNELMESTPAGGAMKLRQMIAEHLRQFRGMDVRPQQILIGAGTDYLYGLLIQLLGMDQSYASENPGYRKLVDVLGAHGVQTQLIGLDDKGLRVDLLERSGAKIVHVTPSHHFPTGITMPAGRRYELLRWAECREDRYIIEDDYDSEFRMNGKPLPALFSEDHADRVIYMNTFTKTLASTIRIGYMVLPPALVRRCRERLGFYACSVSTFEQYTLARFMERGCFEKHIARMRNMSRRKRDCLLACIEESGMGRLAEISEENAGLHFILKIRDEIDHGRFEKELAKRQICLPHLGGYWIGSNDEQDRMKQDQMKQMYLVNYSSVAMDKIEEAVVRIREALRDCIEEKRDEQEAEI